MGRPGVQKRYFQTQPGIPQANPKAFGLSHQLASEVVPLVIKHILSEHHATQGNGHWGCSPGQGRCALPTALAGPIRDHFFAQTLSSRKTPTGKEF